MTDLARRIIQYRATHNLSMRKLADKCGVSVQTIHNIERGLQTPSRLTIEKINIIIGGEHEIFDQQD